MVLWGALMAGSLMMAGCKANSDAALEKSQASAAASSMPTEQLDQGTETYRGFVMDNVLHDETGDIHFHLYVPDSYDGTQPYALFITLPGYQGLYFNGVGENIRTEDFAFEAQNYNARMIVAAPQLNDWNQTSADQTFALTKWLQSAYDIDSSRVYIEYENLPSTKTPVYFVIGEGDEYYGPQPFEQAYASLHQAYQDNGLRDQEIDELLQLDVKPASYFSSSGIDNQHGGGGRLFSHDEQIMSWLFSKVKGE